MNVGGVVGSVRHTGRIFFEKVVIIWFIICIKLRYDDRVVVVVVLVVVI